MKSRNSVYAILVGIVYLLQPSEGITRCIKQSSCSCMSDSGLIDLSPLASNDGPRFQNISGEPGNVYSWNPCRPFTQGNCVNVSACQVRDAEAYSIGTQDSAIFQVENHLLSLIYIATTGGVTRTTVVSIMCSLETNGTLTVLGELPQGSAIYRMRIDTTHACLLRTTTAGSGNSSAPASGTGTRTTGTGTAPTATGPGTAPTATAPGTAPTATGPRTTPTATGTGTAPTATGLTISTTTTTTTTTGAATTSSSFTLLAVTSFVVLVVLLT